MARWAGGPRKRGRLERLEPLERLLVVRSTAPWLAALLLIVAAVGEARAQQPSVPRAEARYVASSQGQVFYWIGCPNWRRLSERDRRFFPTAAAAEAAGYRPSTARGCAPQLDTALIEPTIGGNAPCTVDRIIDGDTFTCEGGSRVRLLLVDADEVGRSVYADSATMLVERLMPVGSRVHLTFDVDLHDRYGRVLAYVYADNVLVNQALARRGFARVAVYPPNVGLIDVIRAAADSARAEGLGVWRGGHDPKLPVRTG
jgi:micrococcal nuclease